MPSNARTERLSLRLSPATRQLLAAAAECSQRSVSAFVTEAALASAHETLASRQRFGLSAEQWAAFQQALDQPDRPLPRVSALFAARGAFDPE